MSKKSSQPSIDRQTLALFWKAGMAYKSDFVLAMLNPLGLLCISTFVPLFIGKAIAAMAVPNGDPGKFIPYIIVAGTVGALINRFSFTFLMRHQARTMGYLQSQALAALLRRSVGFHNDNVGGKLVSDAIDFPNAYSRLSGAFFNGMLPLVVVLVAGSIVIIWESWILGLFIAGTAVLIVGLGAYSSQRRKPIRMRRLVVAKRVTAYVADVILNVQTVKTFAREKDEMAAADKLNNKLVDVRVRDWSVGARSGNNRVVILLLLQTAFVVVAINLVRRNPELLGIGIFAFSFTVTLSNRLFEVNNLLRTVEDAFLDASPMTEILQTDAEIQDKPGAGKLTVSKGAIGLQNVSFKYQDAPDHETVFSNLSLTVAPGEKIGLVGPSGGGKSTLTRLLLRFDDIADGAITIDGQNIAGVTQASLRSAVSYVPQEPLLFHRTIRENIAYGRPDATLEDIRRAARLAHAHEFIEQLSDGYDTIVGERGVKLSGGQRQRVAIARAILKDAPILILDEATSALDSESEVLIQDALWRLMQNRTAIVVAHRLSTIQKMDRILVLQNGTIAEQGTHRQLLRHKGTYAQLWAHQSGGFIEE